MAVKIRLRRMGQKKAPFYRVVVADSRSPRDGRFIEEIGYYNPMTNPAEIKIDAEKAKTWLTNGAQPTETGRGNELVLVLTVAPGDMGKVIGKHGKIAKAIRLVMKAAAGGAGKHVDVEIRDQE